MLWLPQSDTAPGTRWPRDYSKHDLTKTFLFIAFFLVAAVFIHS